MKVILSGVVGSTAYNLATEESDVDRLGVYAEPATAFHGLHLPIDKAASKVTTGPDTAFHEARKFAQLALRCNPTILELLWLNAYEELAVPGQFLIQIRPSFLSAQRVREAYFGYATSQFGKYLRHGSFASKLRKREEKHARHLMRLLHQGYVLYASGRLPVWLDEPEKFHEFGRRVTADTESTEIATAMMARYEDLFDRTTSPLPERSDVETVDYWLRGVRRWHPKEE